MVFSSREGGTSLEAAHETSPSPRVWLLLGEKRGDNAQVVNLARALGWAYEEKNFFVKPRWAVRKPRIRPRLDHLDLERSDPLEEPWPDLVILSGRRLASLGLWIKRASGGHTRLVLIGRPRGADGAIDLAVAPAHYVLPESPHVVRHDLPLMQVEPAILAQAARALEPRVADMARPLTVLLVGGTTGSGLRFDRAIAAELLEQTLAHVAASGGSLFAVTSRRTPRDVVELLERELSGSARLYVFDPDSPEGDNPYHGLLGLADHFVVTTDSSSMMVEVARLGKPLSLFALPCRTGRLEAFLERIGFIAPLSPREDPIPAGGAWTRLLDRLGRPRHTRDLSALPRRLVERGLAVWLGDPPLPPAPYEDEELARIAERVRSLLPSDGRDRADEEPPGARA